MKNFLPIVLFVLFSFNASAQYVTIPDTIFRNYLKSQYPLCFNSNKQMNTACSAIVNATTLDVENKNIYNLAGIQYFTSLKSLNCSNNNLVDLPSLPASLTNLYCSTNQLISLPQFPDSLGNIDCSFNQLTSLPTIPASLNNGLICNYNRLTSIPTLPDSMGVFYCDHNQLTSLPSLPVNLIYFTCDNNQLTVLPALPRTLKGLDCQNNALQCLPFLDSNMYTLSATGNQITCLLNYPPSLVDSDIGFTVCSGTECNDSGVTAIISSLPNSAAITIAPNPTNGITTISGNSQYGQADLKVVNLQGKTVYELPNADLSSSATLDLSNLTKGLYFVQISSGETITTQKLVLE